MPRFEISFVALVELDADSHTHAQARIERCLENEFGVYHVHEYKTAAVTPVPVCRCCGDSVRTDLGGSMPKDELCDECGRGKCDRCVEQVRKLWSSEPN